jgi:hypothetical protein
LFSSSVDDGDERHLKAHHWQSFSNPLANDQENQVDFVTLSLPAGLAHWGQ